MDRETVARIIADHVGFRSFDEMAADRSDLRAKIRIGFDVNEPTKADCIVAADQIIALSGSEEGGSACTVSGMSLHGDTQALSQDGFRCGAISNPEDCGWPFCGCDPAAERVLEGIQEHYMAIVPLGDAGLKATVRQILTETCRGEIHAATLAIFDLLGDFSRGAQIQQPSLDHDHTSTTAPLHGAAPESGGER